MREVKVSRIRSVERAIQILNCFSVQEPELSIDQIVERTRLAKATVYRILYTLEYHGLIRYHAPRAVYRLGFQLLNYGGILLSTLAIRTEADEELNQLQLKTRQTVLMGIAEGQSLVYIDSRETLEGLKYSSYIGRLRPLHYGVLGRVLLAYQPPELVDAILSQPIAPTTEHSVVEPEAIVRQLEEIRHQGYLVEVGQTIVGATGVGAPIFNACHRCVAAVGVVGPSAALNPEVLPEVVAAVRQTARAISQKLGWSPLADVATAVPQPVSGQ
ncbi:MAG: IclR family transcriptional regulator [Firmicutes bacterium]|nr:IclR family transcriptional regulator [Alicyclobacillaceae bacterium]MCL6497075.1 IclR family transcriptional regulator [Bacillota bacterium]